MTSVEVDFVTVHRGRMIVPASGYWPEGLRLRPIDSNITIEKLAIPDQAVKVQYVQVIQRILPVPPSENVQAVVYFVAGVCSSGALKGKYSVIY